MKSTLKRALFLLLCVLTSVAEAGETGLFMVPFDLSRAGEYTEMGDSIQAMLVSRLASQPGVQVIEKGVTPAQLEQLLSGRARIVGDKKMRREYLFSGALVEVSGDVRVEVSFYAVDGGTVDRQVEPQRFTILSATDGNLIADINTLVEKIVNDVFTARRPVVSTSPGKREKGASGFVTRHPEEAWKRGEYAGPARAESVAKLTGKDRGERSLFRFDGKLQGVQVVDADNDGQTEIFLFFPDRIEVRRFVSGRLRPVDACAIPPEMRVHACNLADVDGDGRAEIYLSATRGMSVDSAVMNWTEEDGFSWRVRGIGSYIRPVQLPGQGVTLLAQRRGLGRMELRRPGVFLATFEDKKLRFGQPLTLPKGVDLFDFEYADLNGDGRQEMVAIDDRNHLQVFSSAGELLFVSDSRYGGSKVVIGPGEEGADDQAGAADAGADQDFERELLAMPGRIQPLDVNGDGRSEILVARLKMPGMGFFSGLRSSRSGRVAGLSWNGKKLVSFWETPSFQGCLSDFVFSPAKEAEGVRTGLLYVTSLPAGGTVSSLLPGRGDSTLLTVTIDFSSAQKKGRRRE